MESYVAIAKEEASTKAREEGLGMSALREAVAKAEEEARAQHTGTSVDYDTVNTDVLVPALEAYTSALSAYYRAADAAEQAYIQEHLPEAEAAAEAEREAKLAAGQEVSEDEEVTVDMSGFVATEEMTALMVQADEAYLAVGEALKGIYPVLDDAALETLHDTIQAIVYQSGDDFTTQYDRYMDAGSGEALSNTTTAFFIRYADDLIYCGVALILAALALLFSRTLVVKLGIPRIIISLFFILLCLLALLYDLSLSTLLSNSVVRMGMNAIMVLAMVPGIQCGISLNLGLPIGTGGGPDRRPDDHRVWHPRLGRLPVCHCGRRCDRGGGGLAVWPAAQPPQGRGNVGDDVCGLLHRIGDVYRLAGAALYVAQAALAAGHGPSQHHRSGQQQLQAYPG